jgi:hypothetical protein
MRLVRSLLLAALLLPAVSADAQTVVGTFRWQLQPYGAIVNLTVTQRPGGVFELIGYEEVCAGLLSRLPVTGVAVPQTDGRVMLGFTTINEFGRGLHTRAVIQLTDFNGFYSDNAGNSGFPFIFNPGSICPLGPRTGPISPDQGVPGPQ